MKDIQCFSQKLFAMVAVFFFFFTQIGVKAQPIDTALTVFSTPDKLWSWRTPSPFGGKFNSVEFIGSAATNPIAVAGGDFGIVAKANISVVSEKLKWNQSNVPGDFTESTKSIKFYTDNQNGFLISRRFLLKTVNAGTDWVVDNSLPGYGGYLFYQLKMVNDTMFLFGKSRTDFSNVLFFRAINGSWTLDTDGVPSNNIVFYMDYPYFWTPNGEIYKNQTLILTVPGVLDVAAYGENDFLFLYSSDGIGIKLCKNHPSNDIGATATTYNGIIATQDEFKNLKYAKIRVVDTSEVYVFNVALHKFSKQLTEYTCVTKTIAPEVSVVEKPIIVDFSKRGRYRVCVTNTPYIYASNSEYFTPTKPQSDIIIKHARCVYSTDANTFYVIQSNNPGIAAKTVIYKSIDKGKNWNVLTTMSIKLDSVEKFFVLPDNSTAYVLAYDLGTKRRQMYWHSLVSKITTSVALNGEVVDFYFIDNEKGWVLTEGAVDSTYELSTTNLANRRDSCPIFIRIFEFKNNDYTKKKNLNCLWFTSESLGFVGGGVNGGQAVLAATFDGGNTFTNEGIVISGGSELKGIQFIGQQKGFVTSMKGSFSRTRDGGGRTDSWIGPIQLKYENGDLVTQPVYNFQFWSDIEGYTVLIEGFLTTPEGGLVIQDDGTNYFATMKLKKSPLGFNLGYYQKTPSMLVTDAGFSTFLYSRGLYTFTSYGFYNEIENSGSVAVNNGGTGNSILELPQTSDTSGYYTVNTSALTNDLMVYAPDGFIISKDRNTWSDSLLYDHPTEVGAGHNTLTVYVKYGVATRKTLSSQNADIPNTIRGHLVFSSKGTVTTVGYLKAKYTDKVPSVSQLSLSVSPNPSAGMFFIDSENLVNASLSVKDISGKVVYSEKNVNGTSTNLNLSHLSSGMYFLEIRSAKGISIKKIVKQ